MPRLLLLPVAVMSFVSCLHAAILNTQVTGFDDSELRVLTHVTRFWEEVILDPITVDVTFTMRDLAGDLLGASFGFVQDADGMPKEANVEIDTREGAVFGWFVDPTPDNAEEFVPGSTPWHYRGKPATSAGQHYDLLTVLHHEVAHVLGFSTAYTRFESRVQLAEDGFLRTFTGDTTQATLAPEYEGTHLSDSVHPNDLLIAFQGRGERMLPTDLDLGMLADSYGYTLDLDPGQAVPEPVSTSAVAIALLYILLRRKSESASVCALGSIRADPVCQDKEQA